MAESTWSGNGIEVALYQVLVRVAPDWVLPPIAVYAERGWVLLTDGGSSLGDRLADTDLAGALVAVLPQYGQLQRDLIPHSEACCPLASLTCRPRPCRLHGNRKLSADDPAILRARDAYLEVFSDVAPHAELVEELELACRVGKIARALTWDRALRVQGYDQAGKFARSPLRAWSPCWPTPDWHTSDLLPPRLLDQSYWLKLELPKGQLSI